MCVEVKIGDEIMGNVEQLRRHMTRLVLNVKAAAIHDGEDCCLCPVNLPATAKLNGFAGEWDSEARMIYEMKPR
jgi:hypothetical protein